MFPPVRRWIIFCVLAIVSFYILFQLLDSSPAQPSAPFSPHRYDHNSLPARFRWSNVAQRYPVLSKVGLPTTSPVPIPRIQHSFERENKADKRERLRRLEAVRKSFLHSWSGYKQHAWLQDEVTPLTGTYKNGFGGWGATLVDSLDTLWIMGLKKDFAIAVSALKSIDFTTSPLDTINVFETTIRYLGGLLSAYDVSGAQYPALLEKATELGEMLYVAFDTPNRMPITHWDWKK